MASCSSSASRSVSPASRSIWSSDVDTIHDVIMARIDRLEETAKQTLQLASVIGREFIRRLLDRIAQARGRTEQLLRDLKMPSASSAGGI